MIRFACPRCKTILQAADDQAGAVIACSTCKTQLRAPRSAAVPAASPKPNAPALAPIQWYYSRDGQRFGPFTEAQLRAMAASGQVRPTDQVCSSASPQWTAAGVLLGAAPSPVMAPPPATPPTPAGSGSAKDAGNGFVRETGETARGTWAQTRRLMAYGGGLLRTPRLRRTAEDAERALGQRMVQAGAGDPGVRARIAAVDETIRQAEAAKKSSRAPRAERDRLLRQLAAPAVTGPTPAPGLEQDHARVRDAHTAVQKHLDGLKSARAGLPPTDRAGWRRVFVGYGVAGGALLFGAAMVLALAYFFRPWAPGQPTAQNRPDDPTHPSGSQDPTNPKGSPAPNTLLVVEKPLWAANGGQFWGSPTHFVFMPDGNLLFVRADNGETKFFTLDKGEDSPQRGFMIRSGDLNFVGLPHRWDDDALFARYCADDKYASLQEGIRRIAKQASSPLNEADKFLSPDGKTLAVAVEPRPLHLWDMETGKEKTLQLEAEDKYDAGPYPYHVLAAAFSPDGKKLAAWGADDTKKRLKIWDLETGKKLATLDVGSSAYTLQVRPLVFSPDGALLAANVPQKDQHIQPTLWDCANWQQAGTLERMEGASNFRVRAFSPDHKVVATSDGATRYHITTWDARTGKMMHRTDEVDAEDVFFSPDGMSLIAGGNDYQLKTEPLHDVNVWDVASGRLTHRLTDAGIYTVALGPDGKTLATGHVRPDQNTPSQVKLWDLTKGKAIAVEPEASGAGTKDDPIRLTALRLYSDYQKNALSADDQYNRKWLAVTGEVVTRDDSPADFGEATLMGLRGSPVAGEMVSFYFDKKNLGMLKRLDDSDKPPIIGQCLGAKDVDSGKTGRKMTVRLIGCTIPPR